ncbi:MBL fold metallo-hydrolase [Roseomonas chloroacetimidivorans]|uniref:MBL fold metallo-hydrolase n=1 Tax=Roseomonas chloroacetimidivorans TaxID=1766656 RepID=UPI003C74F860
MPSQAIVQGFYDDQTGSVSYVVADPQTRKCAVIDPLLGFDRNSCSLATQPADEIANYIQERGLIPEWALDTHPHADHLSAVAYLGERLGVPTGIGEQTLAVQAIWSDIYNIPDLQARERDYWDHMFADGHRFNLGALEVRVMFSPGHTAASVTYVVGDAAFVHDTLFMPDAGTARADFPGGDARALYRSIQSILALPPTTRLFTGHDYRPGGREPRWESTVAEQQATNIHLRDSGGEDGFVRLREERDRTLPLPAMMLFALQVNLRGGRLPKPEANGTSYLKLPIDRFRTSAARTVDAE